jgi:hypothetical protein
MGYLLGDGGMEVGGCTGICRGEIVRNERRDLRGVLLVRKMSGMSRLEKGENGLLRGEMMCERWTRWLGRRWRLCLRLVSLQRTGQSFKCSLLKD